MTIAEKRFTSWLMATKNKSGVGRGEEERRDCLVVQTADSTP